MDSDARYAGARLEPLAICAAIVGGRAERGPNPNRPIHPMDVVHSALEAWRVGAAMLHLHAREPDGSPTNDIQAYRNMASAIRDAGCDAILNFSSGDNGGRSRHEDRLLVACAGAEIVSLSGGSFNTGQRLYNNAPSYQRQLARLIREAGAKPEIEIFDTGQLQAFRALLTEGLITAPCLVTLVFGLPGSLEADPELLRWMARRLPTGSHWTISCQCDDVQLHRDMQLTALMLGGHIRTGLEDCQRTLDGALAPSNAAMVADWVRFAHAVSRPLASPAQLRKTLGLAGFAPVPAEGERA